MSLTTYGIIYGICGLLTGLSFIYTNNKYYGRRPSVDKYLYGLSLVLAVFWPMGLPIFGFHYRNIIVSVVKGRDWADDCDGSDALKALMRMDEEEAKEFIKGMEETFHRQFAGTTVSIPEDGDNTEQTLN
jgi:hypothetical protein